MISAKIHFEELTWAAFSFGMFLLVPFCKIFNLSLWKMMIISIVSKFLSISQMSEFFMYGMKQITDREKKSKHSNHYSQNIKILKHQRNISVITYILGMIILLFGMIIDVEIKDATFVNQITLVSFGMMFLVMAVNKNTSRITDEYIAGLDQIEKLQEEIQRFQETENKLNKIKNTIENEN